MMSPITREDETSWQTNLNQAYKIAMVGLLAALSYVVFTYGQVKITLPGGDATSISILGTAVCVIGALLVGGFHGGLGGAIGMTIGDTSRSGLYCICTEDIYLQTLHRTDRRIRSASSGQH